MATKRGSESGKRGARPARPPPPAPPPPEAFDFSQILSIADALPMAIAFVDPAAGEDAQGDARKAIRLRNEPGKAGGTDSIYRYDRAGLMAALLRAGEELAA